jgi:biopolymer transport protein ExbD
MQSRLNKFRSHTSFFKTSARLLSDTNLALTPLVDVIFLLLIFFMISSSLVFQPGITVNLPETRQEFKSVADKLIISLTKENLLFFNDQRLEDWNHLEQKLANMAYNLDANQRRNTDAASGKTRTPIVILKADKDVSYNDIVKIMSITRRYGLNIFLVTKTEEM